MGICFVGKKKGAGRRGFQEFIGDYIEEKVGQFVDIDTNEVVGTHNGVHQWTVGQRTRIKRGNLPYFVVSKHADKNEILVASEIDHPALYSDTFFTSSPHWISVHPEELSSAAKDRMLECEFRFQNVAPLSKEISIFNTTLDGNISLKIKKKLVFK